MADPSRRRIPDIVAKWARPDLLDEVDCVGNPGATLDELELLFRSRNLVRHSAASTILNNAAWAMNQCLWSARPDLAAVDRTFGAAETLFRRVDENPEDCPAGLLYMFWDIACGRGNCGGEEIEVDPTCKRLLMALSNILSLTAKECQLSALHGLNHIPSEAVSRIIHHHYASLVDDEARALAGEALQGCAL
jgi:hypothetical protein